MRASRLAFVLADLEREVRDLAPNAPAPEIALAPGAFLPVVEVLASHYGVPARPGITEYAAGNMLLKLRRDGP